jgi:hypothetical protein
MAFAYLCFCMFLLFFICLVIFQGAVTENLGIGEPSILLALATHPTST